MPGRDQALSLQIHSVSITFTTKIQSSKVHATQITMAGARALAMEPPKLPKLDTSPGLAPFRILMLDGGGIRGYSSLLILKEIMVRFNNRMFGYHDPNHMPLISELFDIVVGTSTGGLIALMLVKLGMTVDECIEQYKTLSEQIFGRKRSWTERISSRDYSKYSGDALRQFVVNLMQNQDRRFKEDFELKQKLNDADGCRQLPDIRCSVVCRQRLQNWSRSRVDEAVLLCSHRSKPLPDGKRSCYNCKIAEAARATSAAPTYFASIEVKNMDLVDGGYGDTNNPSKVAFQHYRFMEEIPGHYPVTMVNIGTGTCPDGKLPTAPWWWGLTPDVLRPLFTVVTDAIHHLTMSEQTAKEMKFMADFILPKSSSFTRFSANNGLHAIALDDWAKVIDNSDQGIEKLTEAYIKTVTEELDAVVEKLYQGHMRKTRASQAALEPVIDILARSPAASPQTETLFPRLRSQRPLSIAESLDGNAPGLRGPSIPTDEPGPAMPRTPVQEPARHIEVVDTEQEVPSVGTQFLSGEASSPPVIAVTPPKPQWAALVRKTTRVSTFPSKSSGSQLHEH